MTPDEITKAIDELDQRLSDSRPSALMTGVDVLSELLRMSRAYMAAQQAESVVEAGAAAIWEVWRISVQSPEHYRDISWEKVKGWATEHDVARCLVELCHEEAFAALTAAGIKAAEIERERDVFAQDRSLSEIEAGRARMWKTRAEAAEALERGRDEAIERAVEAERERVTALEDVLRAIVDRLDFIHADKQFASVWQISHLHAGPYTGPTYVAELARARAALAGVAVERERVRTLEDALRPFAAVAEHDIGSDEADVDQFRPMIKYNKAPLLLVGDLRRARVALAGAAAEGDASAAREAHRQSFDEVALEAARKIDEIFFFGPRGFLTTNDVRRRARVQCLILDLLAEHTAAEGDGERVRHLKSGHVCTVLYRGAQLQAGSPLADMQAMVVYEHGGSIWCRPESEFNDGRFVPYPPPSAGAREGER